MQSPRLKENRGIRCSYLLNAIVEIQTRNKQKNIINKKGEKMEPKKEHKCLRCGYTWRSAKDKPAACPYCKSYKWNLKREEEK